jgi:hypothetical protein
MRKTLLVLILAATAVAGLVAATAFGAGAQRVQLVGPFGDFYCQTGELVFDQNPGFGFVVLHAADHRATAVIGIRHQRPHTRYVLRLVQTTPDSRDCYSIDGHVTSNAAGNATVRLSEPLLRDATGLNVVADTRSLFGTPTFVAAHPLTIATTHATPTPRFDVPHGRSGATASRG